MVRGYLAAPGEACFDQDPRGMTNRRNRLPAVIEIFDENDGVLIGAQQIGIDLAAWDD